SQQRVPQQQQQRQRQQWQCNSVFTSLNFWGANIVIFANIIYIIPYLIVVLVYAAVPGLGKRAYNKAVICYNVSQIILNGILIGIGACILCHVPIQSNIYIFTGLTIMFLTISSTFWLFVICIDMTLAITRFRYTLPTGSTRQEEKKKFLTYATWTWGGSFLPTVLACVAELSPLLPQLSPIRPNFSKFDDGANLAVILYVTTFPALACLANTILFCYTSYKMILIQKATSVATASNNHLRINTVKKRYFLFLRLYLLMDAPWITSALAAAFTDLWILKFLRMIQPILMLSAILPPRTTTRIFSCTTLIRKSNRTV
ncbi:G-protein coupled receptor Mth2, partial [Xylocopa sonorina]|uniref:G-protein coupled receptor Mth2 n=1 Tax=Xylocopa sonorina TaxID=1818115 RepID=UPI00403B011F